jgi:hypothetical protein
MLEGSDLNHALLDSHRRRPADHDGVTRPLEALFYYFRLEDQIPETHLLRLIEKHISFAFVRERLKASYSDSGLVPTALFDSVPLTGTEHSQTRIDEEPMHERRDCGKLI